MTHSLKISTYNITYSTRINQDNEHKYGWNVRWPIIKKNLLSENADIICLQEVFTDFIPDISKFAREHKYNLITTIFNRRKNTSDKYEYACVLSKQPALSYSVHCTKYFEKKQKRYPYMKVDFEGFSITNCHLSTNKSIRLETFNTIFNHPRTIVVGDFNTFTRDWTEIKQTIAKYNMSDATDMYNSPTPVIRSYYPFDYESQFATIPAHLDHIYYNANEFTFEKASVLECKKSSDHYMVTGCFTINK